MRKRIINQNPQNVSPVDQSWLDLQRLAQVEVTSEEAAHPIEAALIPSVGSGWRAAQAGEQTIRLLFDELQRVRGDGTGTKNRSGHKWRRYPRIDCAVTHRIISRAALAAYIAGRSITTACT